MANNTDALRDTRDELLLKERFRLRVGTAKVALRNLHILSEEGFPISESNVNRIVSIFSTEGVLRYEPENYVPVLISSTLLSRCLELSQVSSSDLRDEDCLPLLKFPEGNQLRVLHGRHRLLAASKHLTVRHGRWWIVELYSDDLSVANTTYLREFYTNAQSFSDGHIYRRLRQCQLNHDCAGSSKWFARLSLAKTKDVKQLHEKEKEITHALDRLLPYQGLWSRIELGMLHRVLPMHCSYEAVNYLTVVADVWDTVTRSDPVLQSCVDSTTVAFLETLTPMMSHEDRTAIERAMDDSSIFTSISDDEARLTVLRRLQQLTRPIFSIFTFFQDMKLLELGMKPLRSLLPKDGQGRASLRDRFARIHFDMADVSSTTVQTSETVSVPIECDSCDFLPITICQLFLLALRHFVALNQVQPRKENGKPRPVKPESYERATSLLAQLAYHLGYRSFEIDRMRQRRSNQEIVSRFLHQLLPEDEFICESGAKAELVNEICQRVNRIGHPHGGSGHPTYVAQTNGVIKRHRYGRPFEDDHAIDRKHLFFRNIFLDQDPNPARFLTSFGMKRFVILAFFGDLCVRDTVSSDQDHYNIDRPPEEFEEQKPSSPRPPTRRIRSRSLIDQTPGSRTIGQDFYRHQSSRQSLPNNDIEHFVMQRTQKATRTDNVLLVPENNEHVLFSLQTGKAAFKEHTARLANENYCFWVIETPSVVITRGVQALWDNMGVCGLVIALRKSGNKRDGSRHNAPYIGGSLAGLLTYISYLLDEDGVTSPGER